jgi:hypothetical protein
VNLRRILQHHHVFALKAAEAQFGDGLAAVFQQALFVGRIGPGMRHHLGAVARTDALLEQLDNLVDSSRVDQTLFDQQ